MTLKNAKIIMWSFLFGMTTGSLMAISIKYPVSDEDIEAVKQICEANGGLERLKVGLSGKVYVVACKNGNVFKI